MNQDNSYLLHLNQFESNIKTSWQELQTEKDFCDMTLACEDKQILTHKIIISSSSLVFRNILKQNSNPHPVIYLRGVKYKYLQYLINFIHQGEVSVAEEDLSGFLEVAEDLKIRGLSEGGFDPKKEFPKEVDQKSMEPSPKKKCPEEKNTNIINNIYVPEIIRPPTELKNEELRDKYSQIVETKEKKSKVDQPEKPKNNGHLISVNGGRQFSCDMCDKQYSQSGPLGRHKASAHEGVRYPCDECDISPFTQSGGLKQHKASAHEGVRYTCDKCDYKATQKGNLIGHTKRVHNI